MKQAIYKIKNIDVKAAKAYIFMIYIYTEKYILDAE